MKKRYLLFLTLFLSKINFICSQEEKEIQLPSVAIGMGVLSFNGDVGKKLDLSSFTRIRTGYTFFVEQRIGMFAGVSVSGLYGKVSNSEQGQYRNLNFESSILQAGANVILHLDNDFIFKRNSVVGPYLFAGLEFLKFDPHGDLENKDGIKYNYWKDGTIRNLAEDDPFASQAVIILRDYTYETQLTNKTENYKRTALAIPFGVGFKLKPTDQLFINLAISYNRTTTDWIDNYKEGKNDGYLFTCVSIEYNFKKRKKNPEKYDRTGDFAKIEDADADKDGVRDIDDKCLDTPKGIKVDRYGCPEDTDKDGVPDYKDKEKNTPFGSVVNQEGVAIKGKTAALSQFDTVAATSRSDVFNQNPSLAYLKDVEAHALEKRGENENNTTPIPDEFKSTDTDKNGFISIAEITAAIDSFFDGSNEYTVEKLNDLIDLFFEQ
jgi:opacity protein-like surface antigen